MGVVSRECATWLKNVFLGVSGRYLVFTSHIVIPLIIRCVTGDFDSVFFPNSLRTKSSYLGDVSYNRWSETGPCGDGGYESFFWCVWKAVDSGTMDEIPMIYYLKIEENLTFLHFCALCFLLFLVLFSYFWHLLFSFSLFRL